MNVASRLGVVCAVWLIAGCSDGNRIEDAAGSGGAVFGASGTGGASGFGGAAGTNTQTGGSGGSGGMNPFPGDGGALLECDPAVPTSATCGGTECPAAGGIGAMTCVVPCCVNDQCGTRRASTQFSSDCALPPEPDSRCPNEMVFGQMVQGCCTDDNRCGIIDTFISNSCVAREDVPSRGGSGLDAQSCDGSGDAGL